MLRAKGPQRNIYQSSSGDRTRLIGMQSGCYDHWATCYPLGVRKYDGCILKVVKAKVMTLETFSGIDYRVMKTGN